MSLELDGHSLTLGLLADTRALASPSLTPAARAVMDRSAERVKQVLASGEAVYGINTGFGALAGKRIADEDLAALQYNLVRSHAAGVGAPLPASVVRRIMLLKANSLASGASGVRAVLVDTLLALLEHDVVPVIPERGSVGASGDLSPLAHLALALIGEGEARQGETRLEGKAVMEAAGLAPLELGPKDGLALLNGTQVSAALAIEGLFAGERLLRSAVVGGALSVEALAGSYAPFDERINTARNQQGQDAIAAAFRALLTGSAIRESHRDCGRVQDPYSTRCQPQVLGAVWDTLAHAATILEREANAATDNPLVFSDAVISGGNFHAAPVGMVADFMAIALADLGSLSERRVDTFMRGVNPALPLFLAPQPGLESGFMLAHVSAAALASENKTFAHPASVDTVPTSAGQEDHVSMAPWAGLKLLRIADNVATMLAIELAAAAVALDRQKPLATTEKLQPVHELIRQHVPAYDADRRHDRDIEALKALVIEGRIAQQLPIDAWRTPW